MAVGLALSACAIQRAQVANEAQDRMVGLTKEQILACMGPPTSKASEGATEVWSYPSGNGRTDVATFGSVGRGGFFSGGGVAESRFCTVNVTMVDGRVNRMNYVGPTGGLLSPNEQCAFAVANCVPKQ
jgi:hypothetical protein